MNLIASQSIIIVEAVSIFSDIVNIYLFLFATGGFFPRDHAFEIDYHFSHKYYGLACKVESATVLWYEALITHVIEDRISPQGLT